MSNWHVLTVPFDAERGSFNEDVITAHVDGREVLSMVPHFFQHEGKPYWTLLVESRALGTRVDGARQAPKPALSPAEEATKSRLHAWRRQRADADGVPPYVVFTNAQASEIARRAPDSLAALREVHGIGERKAARYGAEILEVVRDPSES